MSWIDELRALWDIGGEISGAVTNMIGAVTKLSDAHTNLVVGIDKVIGVNKALINQYTDFVKRVTALEQRNRRLAESFGITAKQSVQLGSDIQRVANQMKIAGDDMITYVTGIRKLVPTVNQSTVANDRNYRGLVRIQQVLTTNLGLSEEQAIAYSGYAAQGGRGIQEQLNSQFALSKAIEDATGLQGSFKMISEGIAEMTEDVQIQYGKIPGNLELAVLKAKSLGINMTTLYNTGKKLLNIEESIGAEMEYQLLSGRRLVDTKGKSLTNSYREATIMGDANKQANILNTILEQEGDTLRNNLFAREQMSQLLGMDEAALSRALQKKSILEKLPGGDALFDQAGDALLASAEAAGASADDLQALAEAEDTRTTDDILKQILLVQMEGFGVTKDVLENQTKYNEASAGAILRSRELAKEALVELKGESGKAAARDIGGALLGYEAAKTLFNAKEVLLNSENTYTGTIYGKNKAEDLISYPGSNRVVTGPFGSFSLDDRDMLFAGDPNQMSGGGTNIATTTTATPVNSNADVVSVLTKIFNEMQIQTSELKKQPNRIFSKNLGGYNAYGS